MTSRKFEDLHCLTVDRGNVTHLYSWQDTGRRENPHNHKICNPPIIEAICEFQLMPDSPWDLTIHGLIYETIKNTFLYHSTLAIVPATR